MSSAARSIPSPPDDALSSARRLRTPRLVMRECLAGVMTSLALVPEVISFSVVAGVRPEVSLLASVVLGLFMSVLGGRPAMVTAAAGSVALVIGPTVRAHGEQYVLPIVLLAGAIQMIFGLAGFARLIRYVPRSVTLGFVNALGILIFLAQVPHVATRSPAVLIACVFTIGVVQFLPRLTQAVPAPLVAIALVTLVTANAGFALPTVGGGAVQHGLPGLTPLRVPLELRTLEVILPAALSVAFVGLLESLLTAKLVDELTNTPSDKARESWALGLANICAGWCGGIAGCAMIGQTVVNVGLGGARTRLSTTVAALVLLLLVTGLSAVMAQIPMVALAAVMMIVALKTIDWNSLRPRSLRRMPRAETAVMLATVAATVFSGNLALGVLAGVSLALVAFARRLARATVSERELCREGREVRYTIRGPLFFGSSHDLLERFAYGADPRLVSIDFTHSQLWDASSVAALDQIDARYRKLGAEVTFTGLDRQSQELHQRLTGQFG